MLSNDRLQSNRFEFKYMIPESVADAVRDHVRAHLVPDKYMEVSAHPHGYLVHSVYLDTVNLSLCKATMNGEKNRFKLRLRYYDANSSSPIFFEVKRRVNDAILKSRAGVHRAAAYELLKGRGPRREDLVSPDNARAMSDLTLFCRLRDELNATATAMNTYRREAYMSRHDNSARLTMDRDLHGANWAGDLHDLSGTHWRKPAIKGVILELKFTQRFPRWMAELVQRFEVQRVSVPKYVECVLAVREPQYAQVGRLGNMAL
jgi:SPX domain protein involved in polyphosphate accumulation